MIARELAERRERPLHRLWTLISGRRLDIADDLPIVGDHRSGLAGSIGAIGFFSVLMVLLTAGTAIGRGYAYSDVVVLLTFQLVVAVAVWRLPWRRASEIWLVAVIGIQAVFVSSLITVTGGDASPYVALYAPVLALAGWYLRAWHAAAAVALVAGTELWRAGVLGDGASLGHLSVSLPIFALLALLARLTSDRLTAFHVLGRRDQLRTAETLDVIRRLDELDPARVPNLSAIVGEVFDAEAVLVTDRDVQASLHHRCRDPEAPECHAAVAIRSMGYAQGSLRLCRALPFSASERRLAAILATAVARALENRRLQGQLEGSG